MGESTERPRKQAQGACRIRVAILQGVVPRYRVPLFARIASDPGLDVVVLTSLGGSWASATSSDPLAWPFEHRILVPRAYRVLGRSVVRFLGFRRVLREVGADVLVVEARVGLLDALGLALFPPSHGRRPSRVIWWTSALSHPDRSRAASAVARWASRMMLKRGDAVLCYGTSAAKRVESMGIPRARVLVAQNAVETQTLADEVERRRAAPVERGRLLFVGKVSGAKHLDWVLAAIALPDLVTKFRLRVVGSGPALAELVSFARVSGVERYLEVFEETWAAAELAEHMTWASVAVLPNKGGLMLNTCMACGVPVICGLADGTEEDLVVDGVTGWRLDGLGSESVARALRRVDALTESEISQVGRAAADRVDRVASLDAASRVVIDAVIRSAVEPERGTVCNGE